MNRARARVSGPEVSLLDGSWRGHPRAGRSGPSPGGGYRARPGPAEPTSWPPISASPAAAARAHGVAPGLGGALIVRASPPTSPREHGGGAAPAPRPALAGGGGAASPARSRWRPRWRRRRGRESGRPPAQPAGPLKLEPVSPRTHGSPRRTVLTSCAGARPHGRADTARSIARERPGSGAAHDDSGRNTASGSRKRCTARAPS